MIAVQLRLSTTFGSASAPRGGGTGGLDRVSGGRFGGGFGGRFGDGFGGWEQLVLTNSGVGSKNASKK